MQSSADKVVSELDQTRELVRKLREKLYPAQNECRALAGEIICSIEKAICTAKASSAGAAELVFSNGGELHVERFNQDSSDKEQKISRRRKILANRTAQVSVSTEAGSEMPPDDGHSWRKYGQKDILGAKYPRSYYRCTHRKTQGCPAMKQVQKSDENPSVLDLTYLGTHTCCFNLPQQTATTTRSQNPRQRLLDQQNSLVLQLDFQTNLVEVRTESSDMEHRDPISSFFFPSTPIEGLSPENGLFGSSPRVDSGYGGILSSALLSPTSYGSNCLLWPPCEMSNQEDSGLTEIFSAANSVTDSPVMDVDFMLEFDEMDTEIDTSTFFL